MSNLYSLLYSMNANGKPSSTFSDDGTILFGPNDLNLSRGQKIIIDTQGRLLIAGTIATEEPKGYVSRFFSSGQLDTTFGENGVTVIDYSFVNDEIFSDLIIDSNGNITLTLSSKLKNFLLIARLSPDGEPDLNFGSDGKGLLFSPKITENLVDTRHLTHGDSDTIYEAHSMSDQHLFSINAFNVIQSKFNRVSSFGNSQMVVIDTEPLLPIAGDHKGRHTFLKSLHFQKSKKRILLTGQLDYRIKKQTFWRDGYTLTSEVFVLAITADGKLDADFGNKGVFRKEINDSDPDVWFTQGLVLGQDGIVLDQQDNLIFGSFYQGLMKNGNTISKLIMIKVGADGKLLNYRLVPHSNSTSPFSIRSITIGPKNEIYLSGSHPANNRSLFFAKFTSDLEAKKITTNWHQITNIPFGTKEIIHDSVVDRDGNYFGVGEIWTSEPIAQRKPILKVKLTLLQTIYAGDNIGEEWTIAISTNHATMRMTRNGFKPGVLNDNLVLYDEPVNIERVRDFGFEALFISAFAQEHDWIFDDLSNLVKDEVIKLRKPGTPIFKDIPLQLVEHPLGIGSCSIILRLKAEMYFGQ